ncbi:GNAT family N-acetyltransferase [Thermosynechococcus sp. QS41]|uniref:GNAT family N-acetyltransferase n=1 Tax=unclassified Thermosynechococcus TaxID=2622553 RepID=UPI00197FF721|nr:MULTISPECIES: GNAT family N-acetyltransferase [unclassified Thermosynechococcus]QSF49270.1 GNAT family N-acetyltransferase [Thermosynechococcus sp. TA-1]WNC22340.1 GNAT family N-acetyltransferase [Thermosynechococcus sp. PP22]WNC52797.1 GNAT family N-acetyltransferase [Thermosynechococcus sp. TG215]WNC57888.1 GNAT family N-acetyltransferase [Thermosynechococcus sp. TG218]WNC60431.1 GNAT family N-acetyltransferase [Thermosynechococcus sp. QS41]
MTDMLVKLYELAVDWPAVMAHQQQGIHYRQPLGSEVDWIVQWVGDRFSAGWRSEVALALSQRPPRGLIAVENGELLGFACYDAAALGLFGPMAVAEPYRGRGIGRLLLQLTLAQMQAAGYAYAVIGWVSSEDFYAKTVGAMPIPNSRPGLWQTALNLGQLTNPSGS